MEKLKRYVRILVYNIKSIRKSTIYKIIGVLLLSLILIWAINTWKKSQNLKTYVVIESSNEFNNQNKVNNKQEDKINIESKEDGINNDTNEVTKNNEIKEETIIDSNTTVIEESNDTKVVSYTEDDVVNYLNETNNMFDTDDLKEDVKERFITIVDFLFYNGSIKGYTFSELSDKVKLNVLKIALSIDSKIDTYFPDYKETISSSTNKVYTSIKTKVIEKYLDITTSICKKDIELCESAKNDFQSMKDAFSISWSIIKEIASSGKENIKEWYEIYSGKTV